MTKTELVDLVNFVYALWNQEPPVTNQKTVYDTWWQMMHDLPVKEANQAARNLSALDGYMPRPGTLRRHTLNLTGVHLPPTPIEAWNQAKHLAETIVNGTYTPADMHPAIHTTIRKTGTQLTTNGDREQFIQTYKQTLEQWELDTYTPKGTP